MLPRLALCCALLVTPLIARAAVPSLREDITRLFNERKWTEAQALLEKASRAEPANAEVRHYLGQAHLGAGNVEKAVEQLEKATELAPTNSRYQLALGGAYGASAGKAGMLSKLGWARKCKAAFEKAVELDPASIDARFSLMEFCRQAPGLIGGGMDKAYEQAAAIQKLDAHRGRTAYASLYVGEKKYAEAFALYDEVLKTSPDDYGTLYQVGRLAAISGQQLERGLAALRRCLTFTDVPAGQPGPAPVHWRSGMILEKMNDPTGARAAYQAALAVDPKHAQAADALKKLH